MLIRVLQTVTTQSKMLYILQFTQFNRAAILGTHLTMKSNSEPASMRTPSRVEKAPSNTGANMCSRATAERLFLLPIAVRKPWEENDAVS